MSRPTKLTPEVQEKIVKDISLGVSYVDAAGACGIDYITFNNWMKRGQEEKKGKYFYFFYAVSQAKSIAFANFTKVITKASMDGEWRAALEYLKRHDPNNWGDSNKLDITTQGEKVNSIDGYDRAISTLANAIRKVVPGQGAEQDGKMDTAK